MRKYTQWILAALVVVVLTTGLVLLPSASRAQRLATIEVVDANDNQVGNVVAATGTNTVFVAFGVKG